jgi:hypothetical protein
VQTKVINSIGVTPSPHREKVNMREKTCRPETNGPGIESKMLTTLRLYSAQTP